MANHGGEIKYEEEYVTNARGLKLFTCRWAPENASAAKALIFLCHGYGMECSISMRGCGTRLAAAGYEVHGVDCEGHGKSSGLQGFIPSFDDVVDDVSNHFSNVSEKKENRKKQRFLLGESMGGALALRLHRKKPEFWDGAVLIAPMCKIADDIKPSPIVIKILTKMLNVIPTWRLTPTPDIIDVAFRDPEVRKEVRSSPYTYKGWPRLKTANELLNVSIDLEKRLDEVHLPFIVLHGENDKVTSLSVSKLLYEYSPSADKTFKSYPGMWHSLSYGELPDNMDVVFADIVQWLDDRALKKHKHGTLVEEQRLGGRDKALVNECG